jgi:molybdopterin-biosynthesis enzyme MoeA-like protein
MARSGILSVAGDEIMHHEIINDDQEYLPDRSPPEGDSVRRIHEIQDRMNKDRQLEEQYLVSVIRNLRSVSWGKTEFLLKK